MPVLGYNITREKIALLILGIFVLLPTALFKMDFTGNWFVDTFSDPFTVFAVIVISGTLLLVRWLHPNTMGFLTVLAVVITAYAYVWTLIL